MCCKQFLEATTVLAISDISATVYLQLCTCNDNFHPIEIIIAPTCMRYESLCESENNDGNLLKSQVKIGRFIKGLQVKYAAY